MSPERWRTARPMARLREGKIDWYSIRNHATDGPVIVSIYDEVGYFGVTAQDFIRDLSTIDGDIELHLSTPGGEVFDGLAIYAALKQRAGNVAVVVDSLAASIGSVIAMAASPGQLAVMPNASLMIHDGFALCVGNAADMMETAKLLDKTSDNIASIYAERTGKPVAEWRAAMLAETWYIGQEAVDAGLADTVLTKAATSKAEAPEPARESAMAAHFDLSFFHNVPAGMRNHAEQPPPEPAAPPPTTPDPEPEAPADTDRGFVVPEAASAPEPEPEAEPVGGPAVQFAWTSTGTGDELLAMIRDALRVRADPKPAPLGMETMPLLDKAIAVHHTDTVDTPWDGPAAVAAMPAEYADLHYCHAWQSAEADASSHTVGDDDVDDKKTSFKFPHHAKDGGPANVAACRNGLARLSGADVPDADRAGIEAHLQAHLDDADGNDAAKDQGGPTPHDQSQPSITFAWDPSMTAAFKEAMQ